MLVKLLGFVPAHVCSAPVRHTDMQECRIVLWCPPPSSSPLSVYWLPSVSTALQYESRVFQRVTGGVSAWPFSGQSMHVFAFPLLSQFVEAACSTADCCQQKSRSGTLNLQTPGRQPGVWRGMGPRAFSIWDSWIKPNNAFSMECVCKGISFC